MEKSATPDDLEDDSCKTFTKEMFYCTAIRQTRKDFPKSELNSNRDMKKGKFDGVIAKNILVSKYKNRGKKFAQPPRDDKST
ncbi:hypothetical protein ILUMI_27413 [Ignelater luminosus]|uniref:Uncharacterized protein n=1 Tax=Ignelater luminosus TaxID=2038154 RepID=A0A8K0C3G8_IGNLU|nr:hypothetical protein ILUMI_27413 [Ignelater luminosus]